MKTRKSNIDEVVAAINEGTCVAFVGAGFAAAAGLPTWKDLLQKLAMHASSSVQGQALDFVKENLLEEPAQLASRCVVIAVGRESIVVQRGIAGLGQRRGSELRDSAAAGATSGE